MPAVTSIIAAVGVAVAAGGAYMQYEGQKDAASAQRAQNALNERRTNLEANRKKRELYRQTMITRAQSLATSTNQGAGGSSAQGGATGDIFNAGQYNVAGVNQGQDFSRQNVGLNNAIGSAGTMASMGSGMSSLGGSIINNAQVISRVIS